MSVNSSGEDRPIPAWLRSAPPVTLLVAGLLLSLAVTTVLATRWRSLGAEVSQLRSDLGASAARQRQLEGELAREHETLRQTENSLEMLRLQVEAVEMQLDGIDYLTRQVQQELGLPQTGGTWEGVPGSGSGGRAYGAPGDEAERLGIAQERLARGLQELQALVSTARQRNADSAAADSADTAGRWRLPSNWPARGPVTSAFGWRIFRGLPNYHTGIDIGMPVGTPVAATGDGIVLGSGWQPSYGWCVFVQHADGYHSLYAHLADVTVRVGDIVEPGTGVGISGSSGTSTGPHLHYEIWKDGRPLDPRPSMDGSGVP